MGHYGKNGRLYLSAKRRKKGGNLPNRKIRMPNTCCVATCRGNYDQDTKVPVFSFPKEEELKKKWLAVIPRKNWPVTKNTRVCEKHFNESDIEWVTIFHNESTGETLTAPMKRPRLKPGAIPTKFPEGVKPRAYLPKKPGSEPDNNKDVSSDKGDEPLTYVAYSTEFPGMSAESPVEKRRHDAGAKEATVISQSRTSILRKRKTEKEGQRENSNDLSQQIAAKPKIDKGEIYLFCELLCRKLRALDEDTREIAMHEINNLVFHFKNSKKRLSNLPFHHAYQSYPHQGQVRNPHQSPVFVTPGHFAPYMLFDKSPSTSRVSQQNFVSHMSLDQSSSSSNRPHQNFVPQVFYGRSPSSRQEHFVSHVLPDQSPLTSSTSQKNFESYILPDQSPSTSRAPQQNFLSHSLPGQSLLTSNSSQKNYGSYILPDQSPSTSSAPQQNFVSHVLPGQSPSTSSKTQKHFESYKLPEQSPSTSSAPQQNFVSHVLLDQSPSTSSISQKHFESYILPDLTACTSTSSTSQQNFESYILPDRSPLTSSASQHIINGNQNEMICKVEPDEL